MPHDFSFDDLYLHRKIIEIHTLAGRETAVCSVRSVDRDDDGYRTCLWLFPLDGSSPRQLTQSGSDNSPSGSPSGDCIALLSTRGDDAPQVHLLDLAGGEARRCGSLPGGASALRWAPDGSRLLVSASVPVDPDQRGARGAPPAPRGPRAPSWPGACRTKRTAWGTCWRARCTCSSSIHKPESTAR